MIKGWTGRRLLIDLSLQRAWSEDIAPGDLRRWLGGRGLNACFFSQNSEPPISPASPENPIAFAVGPLTGTLAPSSGSISIASFSPLSNPPCYGFTRLSGQFGAPLKVAGFDQCVIRGKSDRPVYLWIDNGEVRFEKADHLWGKETTETTVAIQEEKGDRSVEVLCIGPAGERQQPLANVIHRLSWTGDSLGLGYLFGVKQLKAIAIRGKKPVTLHDPKQFLNLCLALQDRIQKDLKKQGLKKKGNLSAASGPEEQWASSLGNYLSGHESCFSCPVNCGRSTEYEEQTFGGIHLEKARCLGPEIGIYDGEWTLRLYRLCRAQGLDPCLTSLLLKEMMNEAEENPFSEDDLGQAGATWEQGEKAFHILRRIVNEGRKSFHLSAPPISENEDLDVLADIISFCRIVVHRLNVITVSNMIDLIQAATGYSLSIEDLRNTVLNILSLESRLREKALHPNEPSSVARPKEDQLGELLRKEIHNSESIIGRTAS